MTGLDGLRDYARRMDKLHVWPGGARLREIADQIEREHDAEVADSPYDAILPEDREAAAWVREHGGLEHARDIWDEMVNLCATIGCEPDIVTDALEALGECTDIVNNRLMPHGTEWPKVDSKKVDFTTSYGPSLGVLEAVEIYNNGACNVMSHDGIVKSVSDIHIAKQDPVGADGLPIKKGETVWHKDGRGPWTVEVVHADTDQVTCLEKINVSGTYPPLMLTHTKPGKFVDSWERLEEDARGLDSGVDRELFTHTHEDIVRRCRALAERERGE